MSKAQFLESLAQRYPNARVVQVATVLWEGWEMDNFVALIRDEAGALQLVGSDRGVIGPVPPQYLTDAIARHRGATLSCERVLAAVAA